MNRCYATLDYHHIHIPRTNVRLSLRGNYSQDLIDEHVQANSISEIYPVYISIIHKLNDLQ